MESRNIEEEEEERQLVSKRGEGEVDFA